MNADAEFERLDAVHFIMGWQQGCDLSHESGLSATGMALDLVVC